ncbi:MAG: hypothetical protein IJ894_12475 [Bacteroidales bacterium]|nr:hypothetical protein [Bacteroidales bacterium]MBR2201533.1 hypothetical protein [Bacteroidales bacterium]MBR3713863.1 hypothetical protein [Bacteroidales bacterium]MBR4273858.1 hypothetical protein [Bacteroidales bacterium]
MRHIFYILALLLLPLAAVAQSDSDDDDEDDRYDTIQPSAVSWRVMIDAETTIGDVGVYGLGVTGGINFAGDHLFYGVGISGMYAFREEETHEEEINTGKETGKVSTQIVYDKYGVDKMYINISMFLRYSVLPQRMFSPVFQFKISKALNERSTSFKSACLGISYKMPDSGHSWTLSVGVCRFDYNVSKKRTVKLDYNSLTVVNLGFKF